jgi:hypothetical protein
MQLVIFLISRAGAAFIYIVRTLDPVPGYGIKLNLNPIDSRIRAEDRRRQTVKDMAKNPSLGQWSAISGVSRRK